MREQDTFRQRDLQANRDGWRHLSDRTGSLKKLIATTKSVTSRQQSPGGIRTTDRNLLRWECYSAIALMRKEIRSRAWHSCRKRHTVVTTHYEQRVWSMEYSESNATMEICLTSQWYNDRINTSDARQMPTTHTRVSLRNTNTTRTPLHGPRLHGAEHIKFMCE